MHNDEVIGGIHSPTILRTVNFFALGFRIRTACRLWRKLSGSPRLGFWLQGSTASNQGIYPLFTWIHWSIVFLAVLRRTNFKNTWAVFHISTTNLKNCYGFDLIWGYSSGRNCHGCESWDQKDGIDGPWVATVADSLVAPVWDWTLNQKCWNYTTINSRCTLWCV